MQRLLNLATPRGWVSLPIAPRTADRLAAALIAARDTQADPALLAEAIAGDPPLALWTLSRAHPHCLTELRTVAALADWLAPRILDELAIPAGMPALAVDGGNSENTCQQGSAVAAQSVAVASLARRLAALAHLDADEAYLLGLVHAAPRWSEFAFGDCGSLLTMLPYWLLTSMAPLDASPPPGATSPIGCVALARDAIGRRDDTALPDAIRPDLPGILAEMDQLQAEVSQPARVGSLADLVARLSRLAALEKRFDETLEHEKLESLKELAYGAGHEINNPLANISARAQTLLTEETDPERRRLLAAINAQAFRAHEMIADMMLFARPPQPKFELVDLVVLLRGVHAELELQAAAQQTQLTLKLPDSAAEIRADATQLAVALRAITLNALEALVTGGHVEMALLESASFDDPVQIAVSDNGPGITAEARRHLFDPFYSGREAGRGLGFGLSKCWRIVTAHGGRIEVASDSSGARFTISLPRDPAGG